MKAKTEKPPDELDGVEARVKKSGNGAHVYLPKEWMGELVRIERIGSYWPSLFQTIVENWNPDESQDLEVIVEFENDSFESTFEIKTLVDSVKMERSPEIMKAVITLKNYNPSEHEPELYRLISEREVGSSGWDGCSYSIFRSRENIDASDEILEFIDGVMWEPIGSVTGIATKERE